MSETVTLIIMLTAVFYTNISATADNNDFELTKFVKRPNENLDLHCSLNGVHEKFNKNITVSWWFLKTCNLCTLNAQEYENEEWELVDCDGVCTVTLAINNTFSSGLYKCKMFPYRVDALHTLQIEIVRTFEIEVMGLPNSPPEILYDTPSSIEVTINATQVIIQCRSHSVQVPTIQWFKQISPSEHDVDEEQALIDSMREISFLENSYRPVASSGIKKLDDDIYLSKLIINNVTEDSIYACAVINYYGYKYRNFMITLAKSTSHADNDEGEEEVQEEGVVDDSFLPRSSDKSLELFFIPLFLLLIVIMQVSSILYLLVYRSIMKETNKIVI